MPITHNYLETAGFKPTAAETTKAELVINLADGTLWSENGSGTVIQVGGKAPIQGTGITVSGYTVSHTAHTGDVTGATALTITDKAVTLAKMADIATASFIGRNTAGTGIPEVLSAATARLILNVEDGAEVNNISDVNATALTGSGDTALHYHSADRSRANHTGTQAASTISDFQTTVSANTDVAASKAITDHISVTQAVDLDSIETRVNALDAAVVLMGTFDASLGSFPGGGTAQAGESWIVSAGGTIDGVVFTANDRIVAILDNASTTTYASNWHKLDYTDAVLSVNSQTGAVVLDADDIDDTATTHKFVTASDITNLGNLSGTNTGDQNIFSTIAVSGQSDIIADATSDTLTFEGSGGVTITTNATTDTITIDASGINGTTNLGIGTHTATGLEVTSSSGSNVTLPLATGASGTNLSGLMSPTQFDKLADGVLLTGEAV